jgi:hypothetical protein
MYSGVSMACCGLRCDTCPLFLATIETDKSRQLTMREEIARQCSEYYKMDIKSEDVTDCDGCIAGTGRLFSGCGQCGIRKCVILRKIGNCAYCPDYACDMLKQHFSLDPGAQERLEELRRSMNINQS